MSGGHCGAACARQCRADCAGIGAVPDALMRSMVQRRVTRKPNATAIGERSEPEHERGAKRARGRRWRRNIVGRNRNGPRRHRSDDAARAVLRSGRAPGHRDAELPRLVDEILGDATAGERDHALRQEVEQFVVAPERGGASVAATPARVQRRARRSAASAPS